MAAAPAGSSSSAVGAGPSSSGPPQAHTQSVPMMHKTTASGHNLSVKIPDGPSSSGASSQPEHPMLWGMQLRYVSFVTTSHALRNLTSC